MNEKILNALSVIANVFEDKNFDAQLEDAEQKNKPHTDENV